MKGPTSVCRSMWRWQKEQNGTNSPRCSASRFTAFYSSERMNMLSHLSNCLSGLGVNLPDLKTLLLVFLDFDFPLALWEKASSRWCSFSSNRVHVVILYSTRRSSYSLSSFAESSNSISVLFLFFRLICVSFKAASIYLSFLLALTGSDSSSNRSIWSSSSYSSLWSKLSSSWPLYDTWLSRFSCCLLSLLLELLPFRSRLFVPRRPPPRSTD